MTTASETTINLLQDRIEILTREEAQTDYIIDNLKSDLADYTDSRARIIARRKALEADLAKLRVADEDIPTEIIPGGSVECPACRAKIGEHCTPITMKNSRAAETIARHSHPSRLYRADDDTLPEVN